MLAFWLGLLVSAPSLKEQLHSKLIPVLVFDFISGVLKMPFDVYQAKKIEQTIYIKSSQSKNLSGKQGRKKKEIKYTPMTPVRERHPCSPASTLMQLPHRLQLTRAI